MNNDLTLNPMQALARRRCSLTPAWLASHNPRCAPLPLAPLAPLPARVGQIPVGPAEGIVWGIASMRQMVSCQQSFMEGEFI